VQTLADEPQERPIGHPFLEHLLQLGAIVTAGGPGSA